MNQSHGTLNPSTSRFKISHHHSENQAKIRNIIYKRLNIIICSKFWHHDLEAWNVVTAEDMIEFKSLKGTPIHATIYAVLSFKPLIG